MADAQKEGPFEVKDHRRFNPDGTARQEEELDQGSGAGTVDAGKIDSEPRIPKPESRTQNFEINFTTFILSLTSTVQISLGLIPHPMTKKPEIDLVSAKQTIDILGMLEEKTKGNLDGQEERILKQILFELRMQYVEISNQRKK